jgi:hypothetical protein
MIFFVAGDVYGGKEKETEKIPTYSMHLMWINKTFDEEQKYICDEEQCLNSTLAWAAKGN